MTLPAQPGSVPGPRDQGRGARSQSDPADASEAQENEECECKVRKAAPGHQALAAWVLPRVQGNNFVKAEVPYSTCTVRTDTEYVPGRYSSAAVLVGMNIGMYSVTYTVHYVNVH